MSKTNMAVDEVRHLAVNRLCRAGLSDATASLVVDESLEAELRGRESHGVVLFPKQMERISDRKGDFKALRAHGATALVDGGDLLGPPVAERAMNMAVERAKDHGVGMVGVRNKFVFVMAGYHPRRVARSGLIGIAASVAVARVAPHGGSEKILGTNPLAIAVPDGTDSPFVLDMAMTKIPAADIRLAKAEGREIPRGCALDSKGEPTTDPAAAIAGAMLTFGGHKGSGLALAVELLAGAVLGVKSGKSETTRRGMLFMAVDPNAFGDAGIILNCIRRTLGDVRGSRPSRDAKGVLVPGDRGESIRAGLLKNGLNVPARIVEFFHDY
ncbi:MAG TPA: Ldh family oxidoreductase [Thermoanaerobaculia bacterium]|nr:Ldh family oxidoreductase [Thermoanaerobaculia bacterium]